MENKISRKSKSKTWLQTPNKKLVPDKAERMRPPPQTARKEERWDIVADVAKAVTTTQLTFRRQSLYDNKSYHQTTHTHQISLSNVVDIIQQNKCESSSVWQLLPVQANSWRWRRLNEVTGNLHSPVLNYQSPGFSTLSLPSNFVNREKWLVKNQLKIFFCFKTWRQLRLSLFWWWWTKIILLISR